MQEWLKLGFKNEILNIKIRFSHGIWPPVGKATMAWMVAMFTILVYYYTALYYSGGGVYRTNTSPGLLWSSHSTNKAGLSLPTNANTKTHIIKQKQVFPREIKESQHIMKLSDEID